MNTAKPDNNRDILHVTLIGYKKVLGTSITIPMEMLNAADLIARIHHPKKQRLKLQVVSLDKTDIQLNAGLQIRCDLTLEDIDQTDMLILPAMWGNPLGVVKKYPEFLDWLRKTAANKPMICAVGTGSYFLAEAGLLDGLVATTHWYYFDQFESQYPKVQLKRERFITKSGRIYCTGSVNSVRDVMLHIIEQHYDEQVANQVSSHFTHELKLSYTTSFLNIPGQNFHDDESIINIQERMHQLFNTEINMQSLTDEFDLTQRSLNRRFKKATGLSPLQYLQQIRLDKAKELLKTTNLNVSEVADSVGYTDAAYFSALFKRKVSLSPGEYRRLVRKKIFKLDI
ncbi:MAG: AraC family transcriptional regulator [Gammaproteobacteria bacterium]|nr:AraC family transcriptional regulator [Gammaproteobacteria bacterium]MAY03648.1 AraC family transcriptional regulator [Gammaproteobacteria bacterium]